MARKGKKDRVIVNKKEKKEKVIVNKKPTTRAKKEVKPMKKTKKERVIVNRTTKSKATKKPAGEHVLAKGVEIKGRGKAHHTATVVYKNHGVYAVNEEGKRVPISKTKATIPMEDLLIREIMRSPKVRASDEAKTSEHVIPPNSPEVYKWWLHPEKYDVKGVDTRGANPVKKLEKIDPKELASLERKMGKPLVINVKGEGKPRATRERKITKTRTKKEVKPVKKTKKERVVVNRKPTTRAKKEVKPVTKSKKERVIVNRKPTTRAKKEVKPVTKTKKERVVVNRKPTTRAKKEVKPVTKSRKEREIVNRKPSTRTKREVKPVTKRKKEKKNKITAPKEPTYHGHTIKEWESITTKINSNIKGNIVCTPDKTGNLICIDKKMHKNYKPDEVLHIYRLVEKKEKK